MTRERERERMEGDYNSWRDMEPDFKKWCVKKVDLYGLNNG